MIIIFLIRLNIYDFCSSSMSNYTVDRLASHFEIELKLQIQLMFNFGWLTLHRDAYEIS